MGSCMSRKSSRKIRAEKSNLYSRPHKKYFNMENVSQEEEKAPAKRATPYTRGQATLFGFKRQYVTTDGTSSQILDNQDNDHFLRSNSVANPNSNFHVPSTPRFPRSRKDDGNQNKVNRFGFRGTSSLPATNKVVDSNYNTFLISATHEISHKNQDKYIPNSEKSTLKLDDKVVYTAVPKMKVLTNSGAATQKLPHSNIPQPTGHPQPTKFTLQSSLLPRPQFAIRLACADDVNNAKIAKTAVNNTRKICGNSGEDFSGDSATTDSGFATNTSGVNGNADTDTLVSLEQLDSSPTFGYHRRNEKRRILGTIITGQKFDVRDLKEPDTEDPTVITEISVIQISGSNANQNTGIVRERSLQLQSKKHPLPQSTHRVSQFSHPTSFSDQSCEDDFSGKESNEEKAFQDTSHNEKCVNNKCFSNSLAVDEDWGHGEAMAEGYCSSGDDSQDCSILNHDLTAIKGVSVPKVSSINTNHRPVILTIEDSRFAALAASASGNMIEDEKSPVDSVFSGSPPTTSVSDDLSKEQTGIVHKENKGSSESPNGVEAAASTISPVSPGTPTNASNSLSLSEGRDFLIDDEIADQPGLTFDDGAGGSGLGGDGTISSGGCSSQLLSVIDNNNTLVDTSSKPVPNNNLCVEGIPLEQRKISNASVGTLSPCESLASDDLMLDYESSGRSSLDCAAESCLDHTTAGLEQSDEEDITSKINSHRDSILKEWSCLINAGPGELALKNARSRCTKGHPLSTPVSVPDSPCSLDSKPRYQNSPLRPPRQIATSECEDGVIRLDRCTFQHMFQDIVSIKTMLHKLKRVFHEAETLNPFDSLAKNKLLSLSDIESLETTDGSHDEVSELRHQLLLLQQQIEEKDNAIKLLQLQMTKYSNGSNEYGKFDIANMCNAATQTERVRPVSAGPSLLQSLPSENMGSLVSLTNSVSQRKKTLTKVKGAWSKPRTSPSPPLEQLNRKVPTATSSGVSHKVTLNGKPQ